ncbi:hypothetical protein ACEPAI_9660 [Sanghuangporus weigelae]
MAGASTSSTLSTSTSQLDSETGDDDENMTPSHGHTHGQRTVGFVSSSTTTAGVAGTSKTLDAGMDAHVVINTNDADDGATDGVVALEQNADVDLVIGGPPGRPGALLAQRLLLDLHIDVIAIHHHTEEQEPYREDGVLLGLQLLAYLSNYSHVRQAFYKDPAVATARGRNTCATESSAWRQTEDDPVAVAVPAVAATVGSKTFDCKFYFWYPHARRTPGARI